MHSDEHWVGFISVEVAHSERKVLDPVELGPERVTLEGSPLCRDLGGRHSIHEFLGLASISNKIGDGDHEEIVFVGESTTFVDSGHL